MKKKLVYVINVDWYFELHWLDRALASRDAGWDVSLISGVTDRSIVDRVTSEGIKVIPWKVSRTGKNIFRELLSLFELMKLLTSENPDLVHSVTVKPNLYSFLVCLIRGYKLVSSVTGLGLLFISRGNFDSIIGWFVRRLYSIVSRHHFIIFENNDDLQVVARTWPARREMLRLIRGAGVSPAMFPLQQPFLINGSLDLLFAARLLREKGLDLLVEAVNELNRQGYATRLRIAGIYDSESSLSFSRAQIDSWSSCTFLEFLGRRDDIPDLIRNSHFICLPTTYGEGIPRILIEGAAMGRPLLATDVPGCREICIDCYNGLLVTPGDHLSIVDKLKMVIHNRSLVEYFSRNSAILFNRGFDSDSVAIFTLQVYRDRMSI